MKMKKIFIILAFFPLIGMPDLFGQKNRLLLFNGKIIVMSNSAVIYRTDSAEELFFRMDIQDDNRKQLISNTIDSLQSYGYWDRLDIIKFYAAHDEQAALLNWKGDYSNSIAINAEFKVDTGFFGNGSDAYINTNFNPFDFNGSYQQNDAGWYSYLWDNEEFPSNETRVNVGVFASNGNNVSSQLNRAGRWRNPYMNDASTITVISPDPDNAQYGMFSMVRDNSLDYQPFANNESFNKVTITSTGLPNNNYYLMCLNNNGSDAFHNFSDYRFFAAGDAFDSADHDQLNQIIMYYLRGLGVIGYTAYYAEENTEVYYKQSGIIPYNPSYRIIAQRGDVKIMTDDDSTIFISNDGDDRWYESVVYFEDADLFSSAFIFSNGKIFLSAIDHRLFVSDDYFETYDTTGMRYRNGADYPFHTPVSSDYPGDYLFNSNIKYWEINGEEQTVFGNYTNVWHGATPVNIYHIKESDDSVYIAYNFGANLSARDDGTSSGGTTGTILGDAANDSIVCRHVHSTGYVESADKFYLCSGDVNTEIMWLEGTMTNDVFSWGKIASGDTAACRYKGTFDVVGDSIVLASDCTADTDWGIWKVHYTELLDTNQFVLKQTVDTICLLSGIRGDEVVVSIIGTDEAFYISDDSGNSFTETILTGSDADQYWYNLGVDYDGFWAIKQRATHLGFSTLIKIK